MHSVFPFSVVAVSHVSLFFFLPPSHLVLHDNCIFSLFASSSFLLPPSCLYYVFLADLLPLSRC